jgi:serine/threonine protein kinase
MKDKPGEDLRRMETEIPLPPAVGATEGGTALKPGTVLLHTYQILNVIGTGGMGEVYRARHLQLGTFHAVKVVRPELVASHTARSLFVQEASVLREVRHDAVVQYDGLFQDEQGRVYLVMEFVAGKRLADLLRERGALAAGDVWKLYGRLARGLAAVHGRGVIHRDLSPDNIILLDGQPERAKLIDFGIAKVEEAHSRTGTEDGGFAGKYSFASPEQLGAGGAHVDARSDLYSLGLVLAAAASGQPLPMGTNKEDALAARRKVPRLPRAIPRALRKELKTLLKPDPRERPSAQDLVKRDLMRVRDETRTQAGKGNGFVLAVGYGSAVLAGIGLALWLAGVPSLATLFEQLFPPTPSQPRVVEQERPPTPPPLPVVKKPVDNPVVPDRIPPDRTVKPDSRPAENVDPPAANPRPRKKNPLPWGQIEREGAIQVE